MRTMRIFSRQFVRGRTILRRVPAYCEEFETWFVTSLPSPRKLLKVQENNEICNIHL